MSADYSTHTEQDAGTSARFDAYDDRDLPTRAELGQEAAWWSDWHKRTDKPPAGMEDRIVAALERAVEKMEGER